MRSNRRSRPKSASFIESKRPSKGRPRPTSRRSRSSFEISKTRSTRASAHLAEQITNHFQAVTGISRRVVLDERFEISVLDPSGHPLQIDQLSQGARDQLLLSIRFGVADLLSSSVPVPFFFDDPFVHLDRQRLELVRKALERLGRRRPWVVLTHRAELADWADPIFVEAAGKVSSPIAIPAGGD